MKDAAELVQNRKTRHTQILAKRAEWKKKGQQYFERHNQHQRDVIMKRREARNNGNFYVAPEAKVAFVIRLKG